MPGGDDDGTGADRAKLDTFDGSNPANYKKWKRRACMMLASLPSTISEKKYGPKLMTYLSGEAESLLDHLDIAKICDNGGDRLIWETLDEKYGPQQIDLLQDALKGFFHELTVRPGESFRQFSARFATARRKLEQEQVKLPEVVLGFMMLKKLRLEAQEESMLLTTTGGSLDIGKIEKAIQSVFPDGKGKSGRQSKDVFQADEIEEAPGGDQEDDLQEAMEMMAEEIQSRSEWDEEDILEAFESYSEVRRKIAEQKRSRGFFPKQTVNKSKTESWKVTGSIRGRIEALKERTRCHRCKKYGHWKKECPLGASGNASTASGSTHKEVMLVEDAGPEVARLWDAFQVEEEVTKTVHWKDQLPNDVGNAGNADSHSTGNRQRLGVPPVVHQEVKRRQQPAEVFQAEELLSADLDPEHATCGVPDTACRRTLVGSETLAQIEHKLRKQGMKAQRAKVSNSFRFGNSGTLVSEESVLLPANIAGKRFVIKAAVLPEGGKYTPLLLSKELLRQLGCVLDLDRDVAYFNKVGCEVSLRETSKGHYAIPLFEHPGAGGAVECFETRSAVVRKHRNTVGQHEYDVKQLEQNSTVNLSDSSRDLVQAPPNQDCQDRTSTDSHASICQQVDDAATCSTRDHGHVGDFAARGSNGQGSHDRSSSRSSQRLGAESTGRQSSGKGRQAQGQADECDLPDRKGLCQMGEEPCGREVQPRDESFEDRRGVRRCQKEDQARRAGSNSRKPSTNELAGNGIHDTGIGTHVTSSGRDGESSGARGVGDGRIKTGRRFRIFPAFPT